MQRNKKQEKKGKKNYNCTKCTKVQRKDQHLQLDIPTATFSASSIPASKAIKKSLKILFPSFPVTNAKTLLRGEGLACLYVT